MGILNLLGEFLGEETGDEHLQYLLIDDRKQPTLWPCGSQQELQQRAMEANSKGYAMYLFSSLEEARHNCPELVMGQEGRKGLLGGLKGLFKSAPAAPQEAPREVSVSEFHVSSLHQVKALCQEMRFQVAANLLEETMARSPGEPESWEYGPHLLAGAAECLFADGRSLDTAGSLLKRAIDICQERSDQEGMIVYHLSAFEVARYRGDQRSAQTLSHNLGLLFEGVDPDRARYYKSQARILSAPEPLLRMQAQIGNSRFEIDDVPNPLPSDGVVNFIPHRNRSTLPPCRAVVEGGKALGAEGQFERALELFHAAASLDKFDPDCHYQKGFNLLHLKKFKEAVAAFDKVEQLAPGWFSSRLDRWLADRLAAGRLSFDHWQALNKLEDGGLRPDQVLQLGGALQPHLSQLGLLYLYCGRALQSQGKTAEARATFLRGMEAELEDEVRTRLFASLAVVVEEPGLRRDLWMQAAELNGHLVSSAAARLALLQAS